MDYAKALEAAVTIAEECLRIPPVRAVWLYGSIARGSLDPHDLDLIFQVEEKIFQSFLRLFNKDMEWRASDLYPSLAFDKGAVRNARLLIARNLLDHRLSFPGTGVDDGKFPLDVLFLPPRWQNRVDEIDSALPEQSRGLIGRIAQDALRFIPRKHQFLPVSQAGTIANKAGTADGLYVLGGEDVGPICNIDRATCEKGGKCSICDKIGTPAEVLTRKVSAYKYLFTPPHLVYAGEMNGQPVYYVVVE